MASGLGFSGYHILEGAVLIKGVFEDICALVALQFLTNALSPQAHSEHQVLWRAGLESFLGMVFL